MSTADWRSRTVGGVTLLLGGVFALAAAAAFHPGAIATAGIQGTAPALERGQRLVIVVWNVQYAAGRSRQFFYDGGPDVHPDPAEAADTLSRIAARIAAENPDVVLLQEVDRGSTRTGGVDQLAVIAGRAGFPVTASAPVHRAPWVPWPPNKHLGRVDTHLGVLSRHHIAQARRVALPPLPDGWLRQQLDLKRAILEVDLPLADGRHMTLMNTHLSAFSNGDGTLARQVAVLSERLEKTGQTWVCGGDFNALPPGDDASRLGLAAAEYPEPETPIAPLFAAHSSAIPAAEHKRRAAAWRTWMPWGSHTPERALDHVFMSKDVEMLRVSVLTDASDLSDHLPIRVEVILPR